MRHTFRTASGERVPVVTEAQMREVDRIAVEDFGLGILQMMENAGRNLAHQVVELLGGEKQPVVVLAGRGGNGGGGLCCARHLHNRGYNVAVVLTASVEQYRGAAGVQLEILQRAGVLPVAQEEQDAAIAGAAVVVDALIGYSLRGAPRGRTEELIRAANAAKGKVISLDLPSGMDATSGETPGAHIRPQRTLTLALPKTGLRRFSGELYLADIGIPPEVYLPLGIHLEPLFSQADVIRLFPYS